MSSSADWDDSTLSSTDGVYLTPTEILYLKQAINARISKEHEEFDEVGVGGEHLEGSARIFLPEDATALAALTKPDGETALDSDDVGRLAYDVELGELHYYDGSEWQPLVVRFGDWTNEDSDEDALAIETEYTVTSDGFVCAYREGSWAEGVTLIGYTPSDTIVQKVYTNTQFLSMMFPVKKDDTWKITSSLADDDEVTIRWLPIGIGVCEK